MPTRSLLQHPRKAALRALLLASVLWAPLTPVRSAEVAPEAAAIAGQAKGLSNNGQSEKAWDLLVKSTRQNPAYGKDLQGAAAEILPELATEINLLQAERNFAGALDKLKIAWGAMLDDDPASRLFVSPTEYNKGKRNLYLLLNEVTINYAREWMDKAKAGSPAAWSEALKYANYCIEYWPQERNPEARTLKADIQEGMGDLSAALATLQDLQGRLANGSPQWLEVWERAKTLAKRIQNGEGNPATPTNFGNTATPQTTAPSGPKPPPAVATAAPKPPPPPPPTSKNPFVAKLQKAWNSVKQTDFKGMLSNLGGISSLSFLVPLLIGVPAVIILYWVVWYMIARGMARRGNFRASLWLKRIKYFGFLAFVAFLASGIKFEKREKRERCPFCSKPIDDISAYSTLNFFVCPHCNQNIKPVYDLKDYIQHLAENVERLVGQRQTAGNQFESPLERDAMQNLVRTIMTLAVRQRATDLHFENEVDGMKVRARIDGMLTESLRFSKGVAPMLTNAMKIHANLDITQRAVPQDGKFNIWIDNSDVDVRVNSAPGPHGNNITMRLLDRRRILVDSTKLGLYGDTLEIFERTIRKPHGLILVTGPSGSGKSTTLYVALSAINTGDRSIITIEDPIEYELKGLKQMQVNVAQDFTFATGLRSILRQDPDVIMVGEVRDKETAEIALDAAMTGHLVFTTLHTIDSATAISRLYDLGVEPRRYAAALDLVIAQRLIRLICPECKKPYKPQPKDVDALKIPPTRELQFFRGAGCSNCNGSGFYGRTGIFESLNPSESIKEVLETNTTAAVIRELARKNGMRTLREEGVLKVLNGLTTTEEVIRVTT